MTPQYKMIDEIITEMFGQPDEMGRYDVDYGNLQAFAARVLETLKDQKQTTGGTVTKGDLLNLFNDFLPAIKCYWNMQLGEGRLLVLWEMHVSGEAYSLPDGDGRMMVYPKKVACHD